MSLQKLCSGESKNNFPLLRIATPVASRHQKQEESNGPFVCVGFEISNFEELLKFKRRSTPFSFKNGVLLRLSYNYIGCSCA